MRDIIQMIEIYFDGIANLVARLTMIIAILVILIGMIQLAFWIPQKPDQTRAAEALELLHSNWRALVVVAVPLFYPAIRKFIEEVRQIGGVYLSRDSRERWEREEWEGVGREDESYAVTSRRRGDNQSGDS